MTLRSSLFTSKSILIDDVVFFDQDTRQTLIAGERALLDVEHRDVTHSVFIDRRSMWRRLNDDLKRMLGRKVSPSAEMETYRGLCIVSLQIIVPEGGLLDFLREKFDEVERVRRVAWVPKSQYCFGIKARYFKQELRFTNVFVHREIRPIPRKHPQHQQHYIVPISFDLYEGDWSILGVTEDVAAVAA